MLLFHTAATTAKGNRGHSCAPRLWLRSSTAATALQGDRGHSCALRLWLRRGTAATAAQSSSQQQQQQHQQQQLMGAAVAFRHSSNLRHEEKCVKTKCISSKNNLMLCLQRLRMGRGNDCEGALRPRLRSAAASSNQSAEQQPSGVN